MLHSSSGHKRSGEVKSFNFSFRSVSNIILPGRKCGFLSAHKLGFQICSSGSFEEVLKVSGPSDRK